jgi:hypothetical protein
VYINDRVARGSRNFEIFSENLVFFNGWTWSRIRCTIIRANLATDLMIAFRADWLSLSMRPCTRVCVSISWIIFGGSVGEDDLSGVVSEVLHSRDRLVSGLNDLNLLERQAAVRRFWPWVSDIETIQLRLDHGFHAFSQREIQNFLPSLDGRFRADGALGDCPSFDWSDGSSCR